MTEKTNDLVSRRPGMIGIWESSKRVRVALSVLCVLIVFLSMYALILDIIDRRISKRVYPVTDGMYVNGGAE